MTSQTAQKPRWIPGAPPVNFYEFGTAIDIHNPRPISPPKEEPSFISATGEAEQPQNPVSFISMYGADDVPVFGRQYGMGGSSRNGESSATGALMASQPERRMKPNAFLNPWEEMLVQADSDLDKYVGGVPPQPSTLLTTLSSGLRTVTDYLRRPMQSSTQSDALEKASEDSVETLLTFPGPSPTTCSICMEDFTSRLKPPAWTTFACLHQPSVCCPCLAQSIKSDLENKIWNQIRCPEENCDAVLIYDDVKRLADAVTFARYEILSFRSAVSRDPNFVWCQKCNFGQLHASGSSFPIVRCLNCNHRSCFNHQVAWHERLTCAEYDLMVEDPDDFVPDIDRPNALAAEQQGQQEQPEEQQEEEEEPTLAREEIHRQRLAEQERQRQKHAEVRREARDVQNAEAARKREIYEQDQPGKDSLRTRLRQERASLAKVDATTKRCPGCRWPIEKNAGCAHMTCIKCTAEFCWDCLSDFKDIRDHGNSRHLRGCRYHSDNLPAS